MKLRNVIYCGDNLYWMRKMPDGCVDLIYADPPFFSNRHYEVIWNDGTEIRSFKDGWSGGINHYIEWMWLRCFEMHRVLKTTGSLYLHCDWHASHYLKVMLDEVFGRTLFRNEIIWAYGAGGVPRQHFPRKHDVLLLYAKSRRSVFNVSDKALRTTYAPSTLEMHYKHVDDQGRRYRIKTSGGKNYLTYAEDGKLVTDVWTDIGGQKARSPKPEALLERVIRASSNEDSLVMDPFCGFGTTLAVAQRLGRDWIGIDVSPTACKLMKRRVEQAGATDVEIVGLPMTDDDITMPT